MKTDLGYFILIVVCIAVLLDAAVQQRKNPRRETPPHLRPEMQTFWGGVFHGYDRLMIGIGKIIVFLIVLNLFF